MVHASMQTTGWLRPPLIGLFVTPGSSGTQSIVVSDAAVRELLETAEKNT
jgi:hypothetical protein